MTDDRTTNDTPDDKLVSEAYAIDTTEDAKKFYRRWAEDYDEHMTDGLGYVSPVIVAELLLAHLDDLDVEVLDIGCGTGLTARPLADKGVKAVDGIDISEDMLAQARETGIFRDLIAADLTKPLELRPANWDALVSSGTFTHGHVGPEPLEALFGLLRPGGLFALTVHKDLWQKDGFEAEIKRLEGAGVADVLERRMDRFYEGGEPEGWFLVCRKR